MMHLADFVFSHGYTVFSAVVPLQHIRPCKPPCMRGVFTHYLLQYSPLYQHVCFDLLKQSRRSSLCTVGESGPGEGDVVSLVLWF